MTLREFQSQLERWIMSQEDPEAVRDYEIIWADFGGVRNVDFRTDHETQTIIMAD
jgi:hypothetical protein